MDLIFDSTAMSVFEALGYKYFCSKPLEQTGHKERLRSIEYWELIPFQTEYEAFDYYFAYGKFCQFCYVLTDEDVLKYIANGQPGVVVYVRAVEDVFTC